MVCERVLYVSAGRSIRQPVVHQWTEHVLSVDQLSRLATPAPSYVILFLPCGVYVSRVCVHTFSVSPALQLGGPIWSEPTNNVRFVRSLLEELETHKQDYEHAARVRGLLAVVSEVQMHAYTYELLLYPLPLL